MARIKLPGVPGALSTNPGAGIGQIRVPGVRIAAAESTGMLMQEGINTAPFVAAAGAAGEIGQAVADLGQRSAAYAQKLAQSKREGDLARADEIMAGAQTDFAIEMEKTQEDEWVNLWTNKYRKRVEEGVAKLGISDRATSQQVEQQMVRLDYTMANKAKYGAFKRKAQRDEEDILNRYDRHKIAGDFDGASLAIDSLVSGNHRTPEQAEKMKADLLKDERSSWVAEALNKDPMGLKQDMDQARATSKSEWFPWMQPGEIAKYASMAESEVSRRQSEAFYNAQNAIAAGDVFDREGIEKAFPDIEPRQLKLLEKQIMENRGYDVAKDGPTFAAARAAILNYNGLEDADGSNARGIQSLIATLPKREAGMLSSALSQQWSSTWKDGNQKSIQERRLGYWTKYMTDLGETGKLGKTGRDPKKWSKITNEQEAFAYGEMLNRKIDELEAWSKANPEAGEVEWREQMSKVIGGEAAAAASEAFKLRQQITADWPPYGGGGLGFPQSRRTPTPTDIRNRIMPNQSKPLGQVDGSLIEAVKGWESFNPNAYSDFKQTSIGYGTKARPGEKSISPEQAEVRLREELASHARRVDDAVAASGIALTPNQRAALISFDFNTGKGAHLIETSDDIDEIAERMGLYTKVTENGRKVHSKGLANRRAKELALFNS